jgi:polysaccharide deacetylase family protein (PEP-CTERM system associated)
MPETLTASPPIISVDVEDWPQSTWDHTLQITARAATNVLRLAKLLERAGVRATMFVLGKFAEAFPAVVRELHSAGHEIASHGYSHVEIFKQSRSQFVDDIRRSKDLLEHIIGERIRGYRAPDFSIVRGTLWALDELGNAGFDYDSSIFPIRHPRYGIPDWPAAPVRVKFRSGREIVEFPIATIYALGRNWPLGGGGYHRLLPGLLSRRLARRVMRTIPFVFYCHPYELDPTELWELAATLHLPVTTRLHQGLGRSRFARRLEVFLAEFGGERISDAFHASAQSHWPLLDAQTLR